MLRGVNFFAKRSKLLQGSQIGVRSVGEKGTESARLSPSHCVLARGASRAVCLIGATNTDTLNIGMGGILILTGCSMQCAWSSGSLGGEEQSVADGYFVC